MPKNWVNAKLNDLSTIQSGGTPSRSKKQYWSGDIPWVKISDLKEWYVNSTTEFITEEGLNNSSTKLFPKGTILFTIFATIGKVGVLDIEACTNQAIAGITPAESIEHKFLTYSLIELSEILKNEGKGVAQKNINLTILKDLNVPIPPLAEQQRIVAKLDELFGHLDSLKTRLDNIPKLLKNFRQAILTQAVTGKLTEEWRVGKELEDVNEYSENLIEYKNQIYIQQMEKWKLESKENTIKLKKPSKPKILPEVEDWENEFSVIIPENWKFVKFNHVTAKIGDVDHKMPKNIDVGVPYLSTGNMKDVNNLDFENSRKISRDDYMILSSKIKPEKGDIIFPRYGTIGRNILIDFDKEFLVSYSCAIIKNLYKLMNPKYVFLVSISPFIKQEISKHVVQTTQANIGIASIEKFLFPLCTLEEQTVIVKRVEHLFAKTDAIEAQYQTLKTKIDSLPQAILAKAFKGELVEQLDTDGSAEDLLEEIKKLKEELVGKKKTRNKKK